MLSLLAVTFAVLIQPPMSYGECTRSLSDAPQSSLMYAEKWANLGGGDEATHCLALALVATDQPHRGAVLLEDLAESIRGDMGAATKLYVQAAEAWMAAEQTSKSYAALRAAYERIPDSPEVHMAAAAVYATGEQWEGVILSLMALERHAALSADALALRARAYVKQNNDKAAARDVASALLLEPRLVDALLMRGELINRGVVIPGDPLKP